MTDSSVADKRRRLGFPSERSRKEEYEQVLRDWIWHDQKVQELGRYKGFFHVIERARLERIIESYDVCDHK